MDDLNGSVASQNDRGPVPATAALLVAGALLAAAVCLSPGTARADRLGVTVSILPQKWMVEAVGGDDIEVMVLVGPGHSPATYEPTASQMARLLDSAVFFSAGVPFENGLLPRLEGQKNGPMIRGPRHASGRNHPDLDPHVWLGFTGAIALIDTIRTTLTDLAPARADTWLVRAADAKFAILQAHAEAKALLGDCPTREFFVFHPAFGHFAAAYGLEQVAVEDHGHEPGPRHLAEMIERAKATGARAIVVQPQFSRKSAAAVAEAVEAELVELDPLAPDVPGNILRIATVLAEVLGCAGDRNSR
jgi:zinc transport system substrate-binding protein